MALTPRDLLAMAGVALAAIALGAGAWLTMAAGESPAGGPDPSTLVAGMSAEPLPSAIASSSEMLVDVQGAVARPGLVRLPLDARVADAIAAAGGYTEAADLLAAASSINLAQPLSDGAQVFVPIRGVATAGGGAGGAGAGDGADGGLVNLNTASPEALEALPGIGPVTVQKIVAARQERPFATLEELLERGVMHSGQLEGIRDLVTL
ncbi:MAG TPA: helix-hairpin-helix domain-containing protein [Candidatus Limnocylindria bacterium]